MNNIKQQSGFSTPKALLVGAAAVIIAGTGMYGWQANKSLDVTNSQTQQVAASSAANVSSNSSQQDGSGLATYTLPTENLKFSYPKFWTTRLTQTSHGPSLVLASKGNATDKTDNLVVVISANNFSKPSGDLSTVIASDNATFVGQNGFLDFVGEGSPDVPSNGTANTLRLSQSTTSPYDVFTTRNMNPQGYISVSAYYINGDVGQPNTMVNPKTPDQFKNTESYNDFTNLVHSFHY
jgi:hypothetical protein